MDCCLDWLNLVQAGFDQCTGTNSVHSGGVITLTTVHAVQRSSFGLGHSDTVAGLRVSPYLVASSTAAFSSLSSVDVVSGISTVD